MRIVAAGEDWVQMRSPAMDRKQPPCRIVKIEFSGRGAASRAKQFTCIEPHHREFILRQRIFFTASAAAQGRVNVSPKDGAALRILGANSVAYLDQTGSGNETAAHLRASGRLTIMFCGFETVPMILRLYGQGRSLWRGTSEYTALLETGYANQEPPGARQIVCLSVDMVQTSCGYGVPLFD